MKRSLGDRSLPEPPGATAETRPEMDVAFARKLDLLGGDVWIAGSSAPFRRRISEALGEDVPIHRGLPRSGAAGTLLLELKSGDLHRPGYFADLQRRLRPDGKLWIVLPKKVYAEATGFPHTWDEVQRAALKTDLVDNKVAAFSDELTAVRFVIRLTRRARASGPARDERPDRARPDRA